MQPLSRARYARFTVLLLVVALFVMPAPAAADVPGRTAAAQIDWLEPNGLSIVDLVGFVPDTYLQGAILTTATWFGIIQYQSGTRVGNQVTIHARIVPRHVAWSTGRSSQFGCLAQPPVFDNWGTVSPPGRLRLSVGGRDVTSELLVAKQVVSGQVQPVANSSAERFSRYAVTPSQATFSGGWAVIPASRGCQFSILQNYDSLDAEFVFDVAPQVKVSVLGKQTFTFHSYIGVGAAGWLTSLVGQLRSKYGDRHDRLNLSVPAGSNYLFVNFPPTPVDMYTGYPESPAARDLNVRLPSGGTYRIQGSDGQLSVDHLNSMGVPFTGQWRDADLSGDSRYLPYFAGGPTLTVPEYFLPAGVAYQPCMTSGGCPRELLDRIYNTRMSLTVVYLQVTRPSAGLARVRLRQVGPGWQELVQSLGVGDRAWSQALSPLSLVQPPRVGDGPTDPTLASAYNRKIFLPLLDRPVASLPPEDRSGCPCGWFAGDGRMLGFIPAP